MIKKHLLFGLGKFLNDKVYNNFKLLYSNQELTW